MLILEQDGKAIVNTDRLNHISVECGKIVGVTDENVYFLGEYEDADATLKDLAKIMAFTEAYVGLICMPDYYGFTKETMKKYMEGTCQS